MGRQARHVRAEHAAEGAGLAGSGALPEAGESREVRLI
jgi:hypothetical protein